MDYRFGDAVEANHSFSIAFNDQTVLVVLNTKQLVLSEVYFL